MNKLNIVAASNESTIVAEYIPEKRKSNHYQSEADLENEFINMLIEQGYENLQIHSEQELVKNLRKQIELINNYKFSETEWNLFFSTYIANANESIKEKTKTIQEDSIKVFKRDDGSSKNIILIDKKNIHNNKLQLINQYMVSQNEGAKYANRYDVTILVNGLPLVHVELKRRGVNIREAFNQINRYQKDSFWSGYGLYEYVQIFIISNGTETKYYSNTTRKEIDESYKKNSKKALNSFEFTSFWADRKNKVIPDLVDFTKTFLSKHVLLNILTKYCVFTSENKLLVMRPYQIAATERILNRIEFSTNYKELGTINAGGYVWHTTGSGKTLTSFKTAQLASKMEFIDKVLFIVDRKDLDYQTMQEYDRYEKGAANSNTSTTVLKKQLEDPNARIIITTIQKLTLFIKKNKSHTVYNKHVVLIFDECHRSQFGDMHREITKSFKKYHLFGFTGTPIFATNAELTGKYVNFKTTSQIFGDRLHTYTVVDAINDNNVLPFRIDCINTIKENPNIIDKNITAIDCERALQDPRRISKIVTYILTHFAQKTKKNKNAFDFLFLTNVNEVATAKSWNEVKERKQSIYITGFNSIFAVASIDFAKLYYTEFERQQKNLPAAQRLKIAVIYSYGVNEDTTDDFVADENNENTEGLDTSSRDFLDRAIKKYNEIYKTNYDTSADKFQNYYRDVSLRMKNREIDLLIVVNMFLTGFDAKTLNTLWIDKNLKYHGLMQAFSRTNRIFNSVKTFGNIVCFRNLEKEINDAIVLFGNKEAKGIVLLRSYNDYYYGYDENEKHHNGFKELIEKLLTNFPIDKSIIGEKAQKEFVQLYSEILRADNILSAFDNFKRQDIIDDRTFQDYRSIYLDLFNNFKSKHKAEKEIINDDVVFEIELIKQIEINIDYILSLVKQSQKTKDKRLSISIIIREINSSPTLRSKKEVILEFIDTINSNVDVYEEWRKFVNQQCKTDLNKIILEEKLKPKETYRFVSNSFRDSELKVTGIGIDTVLPPVSRFSGNIRDKKKTRIITKLLNYFKFYLDLFIGSNCLEK